MIYLFKFILSLVQYDETTRRRIKSIQYKGHKNQSLPQENHNVRGLQELMQMKIKPSAMSQLFFFFTDQGKFIL